MENQDREMIKFYIKWLVTMIFHPDNPEWFLKRWLQTCSYLFQRLPVSSGFYFGCIKTGMKLYKAFNSYMVAWYLYYLKRDTYWPDTNRKMLDNPLCPDASRQLYRQILFHTEPDDLKATILVLPWSGRITSLYRERQVRCGIKPII